MTCSFSLSSFRSLTTKPRSENIKLVFDDEGSKEGGEEGGRQLFCCMSRFQWRMISTSQRHWLGGPCTICLGHFVKSFQAAVVVTPLKPPKPPLLIIIHSFDFNLVNIYMN
ncbi:hypothetical protein AAZX31_02G082900 [Glycine max]